MGANQVLTVNPWLTKLSGEKSYKRKVENYVYKGVCVCVCKKKLLSSNSEESERMYIFTRMGFRKECAKAVCLDSGGSIWKVAVETGVVFPDIIVLAASSIRFLKKVNQTHIRFLASSLTRNYLPWSKISGSQTLWSQDHFALLKRAFVYMNYIVTILEIKAEEILKCSIIY